MRRRMLRWFLAIRNVFRPPIYETVFHEISGHPDFAIVEAIWCKIFVDGYVHVTVLADKAEDLDRPYFLHAEHRLHVILQRPISISIISTNGRDVTSEIFRRPGSRFLYGRE